VRFHPEVVFFLGFLFDSYLVETRPRTPDIAATRTQLNSHGTIFYLTAGEIWLLRLLLGTGFVAVFGGTLMSLSLERKL
jgi:hypothetical protein